MKDFLLQIMMELQAKNNLTVKLAFQVFQQCLEVQELRFDNFNLFLNQEKRLLDLLTLERRELIRRERNTKLTTEELNLESKIKGLFLM